MSPRYRSSGYQESEDEKRDGKSQDTACFMRGEKKRVWHEATRIRESRETLRFETFGESGERAERGKIETTEQASEKESREEKEREVGRETREDGLRNAGSLRIDITS